MTVFTQQRFMLSPDGQQGDWYDIGTEPDCWIDVTEMSDEEFQQLVTERLAERPYIVGMALS